MKCEILRKVFKTEEDENANRNYELESIQEDRVYLSKNEDSKKFRQISAAPDMQSLTKAIKADVPRKGNYVLRVADYGSISASTYDREQGALHYAVYQMMEIPEDEYWNYTKEDGEIEHRVTQYTFEGWQDLKGEEPQVTSEWDDVDEDEDLSDVDDILAEADGVTSRTRIPVPTSTATEPVDLVDLIRGPVELESSELLSEDMARSLLDDAQQILDHEATTIMDLEILILSLKPEVEPITFQLLGLAMSYEVNVKVTQCHPSDMSYEAARGMTRSAVLRIGKVEDNAVIYPGFEGQYADEIESAIHNSLAVAAHVLNRDIDEDLDWCI